MHTFSPLEKMARNFPILIVFVLVTTLVPVAGNKQNNCSVDSHCSPWKNFSTKQFAKDEEYEGSERKIQLNFTKHRPGEETGFKRDNTFTDVLKNLLARVDNAKRKVLGLNSPPQASVVTSPTLKPVVANPANATKTTPAPNNPGPSAVTTAPSASPTSGSTSIGTPGSEASTASPGTVTNSPSPTPTTAVTASANASCNASSGSCPSVKPPGRHNITIAPGVVLTPNGEIILGPQLPLLIGAGQTSGGQPYPGISPGAGQPPGTISLPSGMVTSGHHGAPAQQGRPLFCQILFSSVVIARCSIRI